MAWVRTWRPEAGGSRYACSWLTHVIGGDFGGIDFSKLGGGGGFPTGDEDDDESDDDMPPLEGDEEDAKAETAEEAADAKEVVTSS